MSDEQLRELERQWKETGSVEDEAAFLLARIRQGDLSRERLGLAASFGHAGAGKAMGSNAPAVRKTPESVVKAVAKHCDPRVVLRLAIALGELLLANGEPPIETARAIELTESLLGGDSNPDAVHARWSDVCGIDLILQNPATNEDIGLLVARRAVRLGLKAQALELTQKVALAHAGLYD